MKFLFKKFVPLMMAVMLFTSAFSTQVFAAGTETWYSGWVTEPTITVTNNNLTPVKTMGASGTLHVSCHFEARPDLEPAGCPNIKVTMQIRNTSGTVLRTATLAAGSFWDVINLELPVNQGEQYRIFFDVSSVSYNPNGNWRIADITYSHEIY